MGRRPKKQIECPNPLFLKWLEEWRDESRLKGTKLQHAYSKALSSLHKYPMPLQSGREAMILEGVGESIAKKLDDALAKHQLENGCQTDDQHLCTTSQAQHDRDTCTMFGMHSSIAEPMGLHVPPDHDADNLTVPAPVQRSKQRKQPAKKEYVPGFRTGAYALILTLYTESQKSGSRGYMTLAELQREAQQLCDTSFTIPDPGSRYTAWASMSTLTKKGFVLKTSSPARYSITDEGCALAHKLQLAMADDASSGNQSCVPFTITAGDAHPQSMHITQVLDLDGDDVDFEKDDDDDIACPIPSKIHADNSASANRFTAVHERGGHAHSSSREDFPALPRPSVYMASQQSVSQNFTPEFILKPGNFDIVLCVDFIETTGGSHKSRKDALVPELQSNGVEFSVRKLQVGDFLWVAREKTKPLAGQLCVPAGRELVLDYICERKRMDDLNHSIIDGRFREQKFRLHNCGLRHPIYLVENFGSAQHLSLPEATLQQAIVNTQVIDGFFVKRTHDLKESVAYLTLMTRFLQSFYRDKTLIACPREQLDLMDRGTPSSDITTSSQVHLLTFQEFSESTVKNKVITVSEMFGKQLMQLSGMSADKAITILDKYPTPKSLFEAYQCQPTDKHRETMLANLKYGKAQRNLGPAVSKLVSQLYCTQGCLS